MNLVYDQNLHESLIRSLVVTGVCKDIGSNPDGKSVCFFLCLTVVTDDEHHIFLISLPSLTFTIFLYLSPHITLSTWLNGSTQDAFYQEPSKWPKKPRVSRSSVVRASGRCARGHRFESCRRLRFFFFAPRCDVMNMMNIFLVLLPSLTFTIILCLLLVQYPVHCSSSGSYHWTWNGDCKL